MSEQSNGVQCQNCGCVTLRRAGEVEEKLVAHALDEHVTGEHSPTFDLAGFKERLSKFQISIKQEQERLASVAKHFKERAELAQAQSGSHVTASQTPNQNAPLRQPRLHLGGIARKAWKSIRGFFGGR